MTNEIRVTIASPPDREFLVAEIFIGNEQLAEINRESGAFSIEIYPRPSGEPWRVGFDDLVEVLKVAKGRLESRLPE